MGRPKKGAGIEARLNKYLEEYELDELNGANDLVCLKEMCQLEENMESIQTRIKKLDPTTSAVEIKNLTSAYRETSQSWINMSIELGISRAKRKSEADESPQSYIARLQSQAKDYISKRLKVLRCNNCNLPLAKYIVYIEEDGEPGALNYKDKEIKPLFQEIKVECSKCHNIVSSKDNERKETT
jgi:hypothetical protein